MISRKEKNIAVLKARIEEQENILDGVLSFVGIWTGRKTPSANKLTRLKVLQMLDKCVTGVHVRAFKQGKEARKDNESRSQKTTRARGGVP